MGLLRAESCHQQANIADMVDRLSRKEQGLASMDAIAVINHGCPGLCAKTGSRVAMVLVVIRP